MVPDYANYAADYARRGEAVRAAATAKVLDIVYGPLPAQQIDLFLPAAARPPLHVFIHGGYWQWNERKPYAFVAEQLVPAGAAVATIGYPLCPGVSFGALCDSVRSAIAHLWRNAGDYGYDRDRMHVSGHSAGGHLSALMAATDWPAFATDLPVDLIKSALPISGVYDLEAIRPTPLNDALSLDAATARAHSPLFLPAPGKGPVTLAVGGLESAEFHRQAETHCAHLRALGVAAEVLDIAGKHHFSVVTELAAPGSPLLARACALMGL